MSNEENPFSFFVDVSAEEREQIRTILSSPIFAKERRPTKVQMQLEALYAVEKANHDDCFRRYLRQVSQLPLKSGIVGPVLTTRAFLVQHQCKAIDNLLIKAIASFTGHPGCHVRTCEEGVQDEVVFGRDPNEAASGCGVVIDAVVQCYSFTGTLVFLHAEHLLCRASMNRLVCSASRASFTDRYLGFPLDLSAMTLLFFVDDPAHVAPRLRRKMHELQTDWLTNNFELIAAPVAEKEEETKPDSVSDVVIS